MRTVQRPDRWIARWAVAREEETKPVFVLLVSGSRFATESQHCVKIGRALELVEQKYPATEWRLVLVHGAAPGVDSYCAEWARLSNSFAEVWSFPAEWEKHKQAGRRNPAGPIRNQEMVDHVISERGLGAKVGCLGFPDENAVHLRNAGKKHNSGTLDCLECASKAGILAKEIPLRVSRNAA